jgi:hypothetical protein
MRNSKIASNKILNLIKDKADKVFPLTMCFLLIVIPLISTNFVVTHDGYLYLNSAFSLFKNNFELEYQWLREPGYPLILKVISVFMNNDYSYIFVQSLMLSVSFYIFYYIFFSKVKIGLLTKVFLIIVVINPYFFGWSSTVLQVSPITLCLALITLMIFKSLVGINKNLILYWNLVTIFCWSIALQIGVISILCQFVVILINSRSFTYIKLFMFNIIIFTLITVSWTFYKNDVLERTKYIQSGWNSDLNNAFTSGDKLLIPIDQEIFRNILRSSIKLTGLQTPFNREIESEGILQNAFERCTTWYPTENTYIAGQIQKSINTHCNSVQASSLFSGLIPMGIILWQISNIFLWVALFELLGFYRKRASLVFLPTVLLVISYSALIFSIDRYILPTYLVALMIPARILNTVETKIKFKYFRNTIKE